MKENKRYRIIREHRNNVIFIPEAALTKRIYIQSENREMSWEETLVSLKVLLWELLSIDPIFSIMKKRVFGSRKLRKLKKDYRRLGFGIVPKKYFVLVTTMLPKNLPFIK